MEHKKLTPQFFFLTIGTCVALFTTVVSLITLVFQTLNNAFPDVLNATYSYGYASGSYEGIRAALATLIIFFPAFLILSHFWAKHSRIISSHANLILRKWTLYIILFLMSLTLLIDLVTLVRYFVSGEITSRFILKVVSVFIISLTVGWYYFKELKTKDTKTQYGTYFAIISSLFIVGALVYSFSVMGSPNEQRALRIDATRITDLENIQGQVVTYWQQKEKLPESLTDLVDPLQSWQQIPKDPEFEKGMMYEYNKIDVDTFELCATFLRPLPKGWRENGGGGVYPMGVKDIATSNIGYPGGSYESWDHMEGRTCFSRTIDKERYPPFPKGETQ